MVHAETVLQESANPKSGSLMDAGRIASVGKTKRPIRSRDTFRAHGRCRRFPMWGRTGIFWMRRICGRNSSESWRGALRTAHQLLRVRSHGLSQPAGDETRRTGSRAALSGFVERVGHRSKTTGCHWSGLGDFFPDFQRNNTQEGDHQEVLQPVIVKDVKNRTLLSWVNIV